MPSWIPLLSLVAAFAPQTLASCAYGTHLHRRADVIEAPKFGYSGANGPADWFNLDPEANALCSTGQNQSPINVAEGSFNLVPASDLCIEIPDFKKGAEFENLGSTIEVVADGLGGKITLGNASYELKQFHFHLPSEHLDDGKSMAMEMHMVWQSEASNLAVIGIYIDIHDGGFLPRLTAKASSLVTSVLDSVDRIPKLGDKIHTKALKMSDVVSLLQSGSFKSYSGSLTTPPCSEGVNWFVSTKKVVIPTRTFLKARNVIGYNARFPQNALGDRNMLSTCTHNPDE